MTARNLPRWAIPGVLVAIAVFVAVSPASATETTRQLAPGVTLYQDINTDPECPLIVNVITVDRADPLVGLKPHLAHDAIYAGGPLKGRETVSSITARAGALVGVNADFFPYTGDPLGVCIIDGRLVSEPGNKRAAMAWSESGPMFFDNPILKATLSLPRGITRQIDGINRVRETNQVVAYTDVFGPSTRNKYKGTDLVLASEELPVRVGKKITLTVADVKVNSVDTPIPRGGMVISAGGPAAWFLKENLEPGDNIVVQFDIRSTASCDWNSVEQAVGGGPWLVKDGKEFVDWAHEGFKTTFACFRHPRTAVGATADGKLLIVTVDGRQPVSRGATLSELASLMKRFGAVNAINLDGGGSTAMSVAGMVVNSPSGGPERPVANALLVYAQRPPAEELPDLSISGIASRVTVDSGAQLFLTWGEQAQILTPNQLERVVWGTLGGIGIVNQQGYFTPLNLREGAVSALYARQLASMDVKVVVGIPMEMVVELMPDEQDDLRAQIKVTLFDENLNPLSGSDIALTATGGTLDAAAGTTDEQGEFTTFVTWNPDAEDWSVTASVDAMSATARLSPSPAVTLATGG